MTKITSLPRPLFGRINGLISIFLFFIGSLSAQSENPFTKMIGKSYSEYHDDYVYTVNKLYDDSLSRVKMLNLLKEAAEKDKSGEWEFNYRIIRCHVRFFESRNGSLVPSNGYTAEDQARNLLEIATQAEKKGFHFIHIKALFDAAETYRIFLRDYEQAFSCHHEATTKLEAVTTKEFPPRPLIYCETANLYYMFREYGDAMTYYRKITDDPDLKDNIYNLYCAAMNGLGLCYRYGYKDYLQSDSCFKQILTWTASNSHGKEWLENWNGIAEGNIGYNYYLRGNMDTALFWLLPAISKITHTNNFSFLSQRAANIADIYLKKKDPISAKKYLDLALTSHNKTILLKKDSHLYNVLSRYYSFIGDEEVASVYLDSTLIAAKEENEAFSGLVLRRVEQQLRTADRKIHEQEIHEEKIKSQLYMRIAILLSLASVIILVLLVFILLFYRRKRNAYRELVRRSQDWAGIYSPEKSLVNEETEQTDREDIANIGENAAGEATLLSEENDKATIESIEKVMSENKLYKRIDLTLDILASETGINKYYISGALNRLIGKNFNTYINEYRVKEAVKLISDPDFEHKTSEWIAFESGFNDRTSFYRAFKKITGLSPRDFRKNN